MIHNEPTQALKEAYDNHIFDKVDKEEIKKVIGLMTYESCKLGLIGPEILTNETIQDHLDAKITPTI